MNLCRWLLVGLVALGANGCAGYKLGPVNGAVAGAKAVEINPFTNTTLEPRLGDEVTAQLRRQLQRDIEAQKKVLDRWGKFDCVSPALRASHAE